MKALHSKQTVLTKQNMIVLRTNLGRYKNEYFFRPVLKVGDMT